MAFPADTKRSLVEYAQQQPRTGASRLHTSNIVPKRLAERAWWTNSQSPLLKFFFLLSGFQSSLVVIHFHYSPNNCSHSIRYMTLHFRGRRAAASLRYRNRAKITVIVCEQKPHQVWFSYKSPGGDSAYEGGGDARRKFWIKSLKETDLGVAQAFFYP